MERKSVSPSEGESNHERVGLNQEFTLFDPQRIKSYQPAYPLEIFHSIVTLATGVLPDFPIHIDIRPVLGQKNDVINPFNPKLGYEIDQRDTDPKERREKVYECESDINYLDYSQSLHLLRVESIYKHIEHEKLISAGLSIKDIRGKYQFRQSVLPIMEWLRLHLKIPTENLQLSYEAKPNQTGFEFGKLGFTHYYPSDIGPLPIIRNPLTGLTRNHEGYYLDFPSDLDKLKTMKGRFVLAPEKRSAEEEREDIRNDRQR